jgi:hypothetical protein
MALSTTVVTMEMVSRPVGAIPLVAEANLANLTQSNKTCDFAVCCLSLFNQCVSSLGMLGEKEWEEEWKDREG